MKREKNPGEKNKYDVIRHILKDYASRENPITRKEIEDTAKKMGCHIGRNAIENFIMKRKRNVINIWKHGRLKSEKLSFVKRVRKDGEQRGIGCLKVFLTVSGCIFWILFYTVRL